MLNQFFQKVAAKNDPTDCFNLLIIKKMIFFVLSGILLCLTGGGMNARAQGVSGTFIPFSLDEGLPHSIIMGLCQDSKGLLWIATANGLARYNGYKFTILRADASPDGLPGNKVFAIDKDSQGLLWVRTPNYVSAFDPSTLKFTNYALENESESGVQTASSLLIDRKGWVWIPVSDQAVILLHSQTRELRRLKLNPGKELKQRVLSLAMDSEGHVLLGTDRGGIYRFDHGSQTFTSLLEPVQVGADRAKIQAILPDSSGQLWLATDIGLALFESPEKPLVFFPLTGTTTPGASPSVRVLLPHTRNTFWAGTLAHDLFLFDTDKRLAIQHLHINSSAPETKPFEIRDLLKDNSGNLWVGTFNGGLYKYYLHQKKFHLYSHLSLTEAPLLDKTVWSVFEDSRGSLWVGNLGGVTRIDRASGQFTYYRHNPAAPATSLGNGRVGQIVEDKAGRIWFACWDGYISIFDPATGRFKSFKGGDNDIRGWSFRAMCCDAGGDIWIGSSDSGLVRYDMDAQKFITYSADKQGINGYNDQVIHSLYADRKDDIWIGTLKGVSRYQRATGRFQNYSFSAGRLSLTYVKCIYEDSRGLMWFGTEGSGIFVMNPHTGFFWSLNPANGLPSDDVYGIYEDESGHFWASTTKGICRISIPGYTPSVSRLTIRSYDKSDGLQSNEFKWGAHYRNPRTGELFFGGSGGLNAFFPSQITDNPFVASPVLTGFRLFNTRVDVGDTINGRVLLRRDISYSDSVVLRYNEYDFSLEFATPHYAVPSKNRYAYRLEGYDADWKYTDAEERVCTYTNLRPGTYMFRMKASNNDGVWGAETQLLTIVVLPPWWRTWWAYIIYTAVFAGFVVLLRAVVLYSEKYKNQLAIERLEFEKKEETARSEREIDQFKIRFFMNISHEFRTPLTLILGPLEKILGENDVSATIRKQLLMIQQNTNRLLRLVNQLLDLRKLDTGSMQLRVSNENLSDFLTRIFASFQHVAERQKINYSLQNQIQGKLASQTCFDPDKLEKILYNLIANAFKYTAENGSITISASAEPSGENGNLWASIRVEDTGIGIPADKIAHIFERFYRIETNFTRKQTGTGIGLSLTKELVELHLGSISAESEEGKGSVFTLRLPVSRACYPEHLLVPDINEAADEKYPHIFQTADRLTDEHPEPYEAGDERPLLLLIDDNPDIIRFLADAFQDAYRLIFAGNGEDGLRLAHCHIPDLVICDVMMPVMDGIAFCQASKAHELTSHIPVILLTARTADDQQVQGLEAGADDYVTKPFVTKVLQARIESIIANRRRITGRFASDATVTVSQLAGNPVDRAFLEKVTHILDSHLGNADFDVQELADHLSMSRAQLYRKFKGVSDLTVKEFLRTLRLKKAVELLKSRQHNISEVAFQTGFTDVSHFSTVFSKQFGVPPSRFAFGDEGESENHAE